MGQAIVVAVLVGGAVFGIGKTVQETKKHVVVPVKHAIVRIWKHETKKQAASPYRKKDKVRAKRQTYCWIVEVLCGTVWKPFYEGNPNSTRDWALWEMKKWVEKYGGSKFRVAKYVAERNADG